MRVSQPERSSLDNHLDRVEFATRSHHPVAKLIGSAFAARRADNAAVLPLIHPSDVDDILGADAVLETITARVAAGQPHHVTSVQADLLRAGRLTEPVAKLILDAETVGCCGLESELREHACFVVELSYRRRFESWGQALAAAAGSMAEADLMPLAVREGLAAREHLARLAALRCEEVAA